MPPAAARRLPRDVVRIAVGSVLQAGAQPVRSVRRAFDPNLRRAERWMHRRIVRATAGASVVVALAAVVGIATGLWLVLAGVLAVFAAGALLVAWRARSSRGAAAGWPVGDLRPGPDSLTHIDHFSRRAHRYGPVFKTSFLGAPTVCVADLRTAKELLRAHADELGPPWGPYERFVPGGSVRGAAAPRNAELRRFFAQALTVDVVRSWRPAMARRAALALASLADATTSDGVNPRAAMRALVLDTWSEIFFGIPPDADMFVEAAQLVADLDPDRRLYAHAFADDVLEAKLDRLSELVERARSNRDRSVVPVTLADRFENVEPSALADPALMRNLLYTMITTRDDVAGLLSWVLWHLAEQPQWTVRMRAEPNDADALADRIVSETLRLDQSEFVMRKARADVQFGDCVVPEGWYVRVCIREIHRDDSTFPRAATFDPDRLMGERCSREVYAPFGIDHRFCLGEHLTRTVARIFVLELAARFDVHTVADGPPELSQQRHWAPSSRWRVELSRVDARDE